MSRLIISLTTIPPRFDKIGKTLRDLVNQRVRADEIRLTLARTYRRFPGELPSLPEVPEGVQIHWSDIDYGPATKVLPTVLDTRGQDVDILFCDDDQAYPRDLTAQMLKARKRHPGACIARRGYHLENRGKGARYIPSGPRPQPRLGKHRPGLKDRLLRAATFGMINPPPSSAGHADIFLGFGGVLVKPDFFPPEVYDIPDVLWTVDDPWLSGHLTRMGVPIWVIARHLVETARYEAHSSNPLLHYVYKDHGRVRADTACIEYFRDTYGIWQGPRAKPRQRRAAATVR